MLALSILFYAAASTPRLISAPLLVRLVSNNGNQQVLVRFVECFHEVAKFSSLKLASDKLGAEGIHREKQAYY
jgi:hypothetical protein